MTNAEKYLKDEVDIEEFIKELHLFWWLNEYDICEGIRKFLSAEAKKKKPQLSEDERVILRNIQQEWKTIFRGNTETLALHNGKGGWTAFYPMSHLFQFIKERRRI